ncbi:TPR-like protein [Penicillium malachiteum]|uniref:TPR-like protein n=1 Tax=Penicillium malachiteum TaxID=1324776 RepID=A0AAD6HXZ1_9EURO|nr:TPR-like protein [Penicillium malachiteum]
MYCEGEHNTLHRLQSEIEMCLKQTQPEKKSDSPEPLNKWIVPFERSIRFTGRESELNELQDMLFAHDQFAKAAVSGLGGVGKTQLALELLYRIKEKHYSYTAIWVHATSMESLNQGYYAIAQQLGIRDSRSKEVDFKQLVQDYLSKDSAGHRIMVYDNADNIDMGSRSRNGRAIITTRNRKVVVKLAHQNVTELSRISEGLAFRMLRNLLIQIDLIDSGLTDAKTMTAWLCHLPLAIAQAAAYVNKNGVAVADYLAVLDGQEEDILELISEEFEDVLRYYDVKNPITTTWLVSFRQIQQRDALAAEYMFFVACIDYKDFPQLLLSPGSSRKKEVDAIGTLSAYTFVSRHSEALSIDLHRLVHLTIRNWLRNEDTLVEWSCRTVARLEEVFPDHGHRNKAVWRMYLPHARYVLDSALVAKDNTNRINLEWKLALCYYSDGRFDEVETFFQEVVDFRTSMLGPEHAYTLKSMAKLALTHNAQSRFQESRTLGVKVMEIQKRVLGEEDPDTLSTMSHLAMTYSDLSQWKEAEALELQTMELRMRFLGEEHPETLVGMSNLVYLYNCQGWWGKAEGRGKRTITARKKVLNDDHPETLLSIGDLTHTYNNQGRYKKAEELLTHVVNVRVRTLGKEHPYTLSGMSNLAVSYHNQNWLDETEALQAHVVAARKTCLGPEHFSTLTSMAHLSLTYHRQGRWAGAERLGLEIIELRKKIMGPEHDHTLTSMTNLASIYLDDGQLSRAEELGLEVLAIRARVLGMDHTHSLASMEYLAATYKKQGRITETEDLKLQVAELRKMTVE